MVQTLDRRVEVHGSCTDLFEQAAADARTI
jgi:hypothetical protein